MKKAFLAILAFQFVCYVGFAQQEYKNNTIASPNVASLGIYGNYPVSHFTGIPQINVPITSVNTHGVELPIGLSYHTASVRVKNHPSWVGLGWSMPVGGVISRSINKAPDESQSSTGLPVGFYDHYQELDRPDWSSDEALEDYIINYFGTAPYNKDPQADRFSFNFMGYSGSFYLNHKGEWQVVSADEIKVEFDAETGFLASHELRDNIKDQMQDPAKNAANRYFNIFTLITPDGTRYEFGGKEATEYSVPYRTQHFQIDATAWYLRKITTTTGNEITFTYQADDPVYSIYSGYNKTWYGQDRDGWLSLDCSRSPGGYGFSGTLDMPVYLQRIEYDGGKVEFHRSSSVELDYDYTSYNHEMDQAYFFIYGYPAQHEWKQLDAIEVFHKDQRTEKYQLSYTSSNTERLKLNEIQRVSLLENNTEGDAITLFQFDYNNEQLPTYESDEIDHWGFYNGSGYTFTNSGDHWIDNFITNKAPDATGSFQKAELLEKITFPTGGYTRFEYEPHTYSKEVLVQRVLSNQLTADKVAGGLRIKRVETHANATDQNYQTTEYYYGTGYDPNQPTANYRSSGIMGGIPQYYWQGYTGVDREGDAFYYDRFSTGAVTPYGLNGSGSHIGYSEVTVVEGKALEGHQGYTTYKYTNFDQDVWGIQHGDADIINSMQASRSSYSSYEDFTFKRGLLSYEGVFNATGELLRESKMKYLPTHTNEALRGVQINFLNICGANYTGAIVYFGEAYHIHDMHFNLVDRYTKIIENGVTLHQVEHFDYDEYNHLISERTGVISEPETVETKYFYPTDYITGSFPAMVSANVINPIVKTEQWKNNTFIQSERTTYLYNTWLPSYTYRTGSDGIENTNIYSRYIYNQKGDFVQTTRNAVRPNSILWNDDQLLPIASVSNATHEKAYYDSFESSGTTHTNAYTGQKVAINYTLSLSGFSSGNYLLSYWKLVNGTWEYQQEAIGISGGIFIKNFSGTIDELRIHSSIAQMQTYTYDNRGRIISECGVNGNVLHYEYDGLNRLYKVRDNKRKLIKAYEYKFHTEN